MAGVYVQQCQTDNTPLVIISGLSNVYITIFALNGNVDDVYIGDSNVSYNTKYGLPIGVSSIYQKRIFVTDSNKVYFSGKKGDKIGVVIEQSSVIDDIMPALNDLANLIQQVNGANIGGPSVESVSKADFDSLSAKVDVLANLISHAKKGIII